MSERQEVSNVFRTYRATATRLRGDLEVWAGVSGIPHQDDCVIGSRNSGLGDCHENVPIGEVETLGEWIVDVQKPVLGEEDGSDGVRDAHWFVVGVPPNVVGFPNVPYGRRCWVEDLGDPYVPAGELYRSGKGNRGSGEEESGQSGHEFHREWI